MDWRRQLDVFYAEAVKLKAEGRNAEAADVETKAAAVFEDLERRAGQVPETLDVADALLGLAERDWPIWGDHPNVLSKLERALAIRENLLSSSHSMVAGAVAKLAEFHFLAGRWGESEPLYRRAIALYDQKEDTREASYAACQAGLAQTLFGLGRWAEADPYFVKAIARADDPHVLYFLLMARSECLEKMARPGEADAERRRAHGLLPKNNPGEFGFHV